MNRSLITRARRLLTLPFVRGVAAFQVGSVLMLGIGFLSSVFYARLLGLEQWGMYAIVGAFVSLISIVTSYGQETALATHLAEALGRKDTASAGKVLRYYAQATFVASVFYLVLYLLAPLLAGWMHMDPMIGVLGRMLIINAALQFPSVLLFLSLQLERRITTVVILETGLDFVQLGLSIFFLLQGWGVKGVLLGTLIPTLASVPVYLFLYERSARRQHLPGLWSMVSSIGKGGTMPYIRQGLWIALDQNIGKNINPNIFYILLGMTSSVETVGIFRLAMRLAQLPTSLVMPSITRMTNIAIPRIAGQDPKALLSACKKVLLGTLGLTILACAGAALLVPPLIPFVYGRAYKVVSGPFLFLLMMNVPMIAQVVAVPLLRVLRRIWLIILTNVMGLVVSIVGFLIVVSFASPLWGVCIAVILYNLNGLAVMSLVVSSLRQHVNDVKERASKRKHTAQ